MARTGAQRRRCRSREASTAHSIGTKAKTLKKLSQAVALEELGQRPGGKPFHLLEKGILDMGGLADCPHTGEVYDIAHLDGIWMRRGTVALIARAGRTRPGMASCPEGAHIGAGRPPSWRASRCPRWPFPTALRARSRPYGRGHSSPLSRCESFAEGHGPPPAIPGKRERAPARDAEQPLRDALAPSRRSRFPAAASPCRSAGARFRGAAHRVCRCRGGRSLCQCSEKNQNGGRGP